MGVILFSGTSSTISKDIFGYRNWEMKLTSRAQNPGKLLNMLQIIEDPTTNDYPAKNVSGAGVGDCWSISGLFLAWSCLCDVRSYWLMLMFVNLLRAYKNVLFLPFHDCIHPSSATCLPWATVHTRHIVNAWCWWLSLVERVPREHFLFCDFCEKDMLLLSGVFYWCLRALFS